jgi:hypothetical protein
MEEQRESAVPHIEDAMEPPTGAIEPSLTVDAALERADNEARDWFLLNLLSGRWVIAPVAGLRELQGEGKGALSVGSAMGLATPLPVLYADQRLDTALELIADYPVLPIVHRANPRQLVGTISLAHILASYRRGRK